MYDGERYERKRNFINRLNDRYGTTNSVKLSTLESNKMKDEIETRTPISSVAASALVIYIAGMSYQSWLNLL